MITATVKIENQWKQGEIESEQIEFDTISQIENYLAYNRAYIREIKFSGKIKREED